MKRLINQNRTPKNFKNWVEQHNPELNWDWDNPQNLLKQFCDVVSETGDIDIKTIFEIMFSIADSGLTPEQNKKFLYDNY